MRESNPFRPAEVAIVHPAEDSGNCGNASFGNREQGPSFWVLAEKLSHLTGRSPLI